MTTKQEKEAADMIKRVIAAQKEIKYNGTRFDVILQQEYEKQASVAVGGLYTLKLREAWKKASDNAMLRYIAEVSEEVLQEPANTAP